MLETLHQIHKENEAWEEVEIRNRDVVDGDPDSIVWDRRPRAIAYCGAGELGVPKGRTGSAYGTPVQEFYIWERKNPEKLCEDMRPVQEPRRCGSCKHNAATGAAIVFERLREVVGAFHPNGADVWSEISRDYDNHVVMQLRIVDEADGTPADAPSFLPICRKLSQPGRAVVSILHNRTLQCAGYEPAESPLAPPGDLMQVAELYRQAQKGKVGWGRVATDPKRLAMCEFIAAALTYLGIGASAPGVVMRLKSGADTAAMQDAMKVNTGRQQTWPNC